MNKRQQRLLRIVAASKEYLASRTAASLLATELAADPNYGEQFGWKTKAGVAFAERLEATYIIRMYAEFEAGLRDYWRTYLGRGTHPNMIQLVRHLIPNQFFSQDCIDDADNVRRFRNFLVHDLEDDPPDDMITFEVMEAKKRLCEYFARLDPRWQ